VGRSYRPTFLLLRNKIMEQLFTKKEAARYLKVSVRTVTRMVSDLEVPIYKVGHQVRIPASSINKLLKGPSSEENLNKIINNLYEV
jgi:excisionase family DNA binding protein|tara:strand:+ start:82 stop:339 length:258 start_codon:yes stop_codon:yes gene_type:complete